MLFNVELMEFFVWYPLDKNLDWNTSIADYYADGQIHKGQDMGVVQGKIHRGSEVQENYRCEE